MSAAVQRFGNAEQLAEAAAERFVAAGTRAIGRLGSFRVALAGGDTPRRMYELLAEPRLATRLDWTRTVVCWGDERCVAPTDEASNYRLAHECLLTRVPLPAGNVHRIRGEDAPDKEAQRYGRLLERVLGHPQPRLDQVWLGLGADGHTASLFPGANAVHDSARWVEPAYREVEARWRVTLTPRLINAAAEVCFLVSGGEKAPVVARVLQGPSVPHELPAQLVAPRSGRVAWMLDGAAAAGLAP